MDQDVNGETGGGSASPVRAKDDLSPVWNIRAPRDAAFTDREDALEALGAALKAHRVVVVQEPLAAIGGMGKSALAREFAYRHSKRYQVVWWVQGDEAGVMHVQFSQLMTALNLLRQIPDEPPHTIQSVREFLSTHGGWLLILDGVEQFEKMLDLVPEKPGGHVIVTTARGGASLPFHTIDVEPLASQAGNELLATLEPSVPEENRAQLVMQSGGSPLNLLLLAGWYRHVGSSGGESISDLANKLPGPLREEVTPEIAKAVTRFLVRALSERLERTDRPARDLLSLCAFLSPYDIPRYLFDPKERDEDILSERLSEALTAAGAIDQLLDILESFGFVRRIDGGFMMHEVVQEAVRDNMTSEALRAWTNAAVRLVNDAFPLAAPTGRPDPIATRLLPHALAVTQYAEEVNVAREASSQLLYYAGRHLHGSGALHEAKTCYQLAIALGNKVHGAAHPVIATRINSLGAVEHELGNLKEAKECFEKAFQICEKVYGPVEEAVYGAPDESLLTVPIRNLCAIHEELGDLDAAQRTYEKAMQIYLHIYGWNHPLVAECADRFGRAWHRMGRLAKARNCFEKAVLAEESAGDGDTARLATYLNNLAAVLMDGSEAQLAYDRLERALRLDVHQFGRKHPAVGRDLANLGNACRLLRKFEEAETHYTEALALIEEAEGEDSPHVASLLNHLGVVLLENDKPAEARSCLERALTINEALRGEESNEVVRNLTNLGRVLDALDAGAQALNAFRRALTIVERIESGVSERQATILYRMGRSLESQGEYPEALRELQRALKIDTDVLGNDHPAVARDAYAVGSVLAEMNDPVVAMGHLTLALDIYEKTHGRNSARARKTRRKLEELSGA